MKYRQELFNSFFLKYPLRKYRPGDFVIHADDEIKTIYFIQAGIIKVSSILDNGAERLLLFLKHRDVLPLVWHGKENFRALYYYQTLTPVQLRCVAKEDLFKLIDQNKPPSHDFLIYLHDMSRQLLIKS